MWRAALSSRLRTMRCSSSRLPSSQSRVLVLDPQLAVAHQRRRLDGRVAGDLGEVAAPVAAALAGVGAGEQQQVGDQAAHPVRGAQGGVDHRLVVVVARARQRGLEQLEVGEDAGQRRAQLVRGVGDELALLLHRRLALGAGGVERAQHLLEGPGQLADLVVGLRLRHVARGVAGVGDLAGASRSARRPGASPGRRSPAPARLASRVPPRTPAAMKSQSRSIVESTWARLRPYWT